MEEEDEEGEGEATMQEAQHNTQQGVQRFLDFYFYRVLTSQEGLKAVAQATEEEEDEGEGEATMQEAQHNTQEGEQQKGPATKQHF